MEIIQDALSEFSETFQEEYKKVLIYSILLWWFLPLIIFIIRGIKSIITLSLEDLNKFTNFLGAVLTPRWIDLLTNFSKELLIFLLIVIFINILFILKKNIKD